MTTDNQRHERRWQSFFKTVGSSRWRLYLLLAALIVLSTGAIATAVLVANPVPLPVPTAVADFPLHAHQFGPEAAESIVHLHDSRFPMTGAATAMYGTGEVRVWVARSWSGWGATWMMRRMTRAIVEVNSPFTPEEDRVMDGTMVHSLVGMDQRHYYFQMGKNIYWLTVVPQRSDQALREILDFARNATAPTPLRQVRFARTALNVE